MSRLNEAAEDIVRALKVKKYVFKPSGRVRWIVVGRSRDYLVLPNAPYCSCDDYFFRVIHRGKAMCYHIKAVKLAMERGIYELIEEEDSWYGRLMSEWTDWRGHKLRD